MENLVVFALLGLGLGGIFTILGCSIVVIYKGSGVLNFAAGAIGVVGAYVCFDLRDNHGVPLPLAILVGMLVSAVIGVLMQLLVMDRIRSQSATTKIVATLGLMASLNALSDRIWAPNGGTQPVDSFLPSRTLPLFHGLAIGEDRLWLAGIAVAVTLVLAVWQKRTKTGLATQAVAEGPVVPALMGWSPGTIGAVSWAVGSATATVAAITAADLSALSVTNLTLLVIPALAAALVGRFESLMLTLAGGMAIGVGESVVSSYVRGNPGWATVAPLLVILVILIASGRSLPSKSEIAARLPRVTPGRLGLWSLVLLVAAAAWISTASTVWLGAISITLIFGMLMLSLVIVTGFAGQISLAQLALAGIGAYLTVILNVEAHLPLWLCIAVAAIATAPVGMIVAVPALRTRGSNLAVATLALATVVSQLVLTQAAASPYLASAQMGTLSIFGINFSSVTHLRNFAFLLLVLFAVAALATANLRRSSTGMRFLAIRANERAAASVGIPVARMKLLAFGLAAVLAGAAGGLIESQFIVGDFTQFSESASISVLLNGVLGGIGWISGAATGGASVDSGVASQLISTWINPSDWLDLAVGISVLMVVVFQPDGLAPFNIDAFRRVAARLRLPLPANSSPKISYSPARSRETAAAGGATGGQGSGNGHPVTVETVNLSVRFGTQMALDNVSIAIRSGEIVGMIGSNGAGKSTLVEAMAGFQAPFSGSVAVNGARMRKLNPWNRARSGLVRTFQSLELFEDLSVWENVAVAAATGSLGRRIADVLLPGRFSDYGQAWTAVRQFHLEDDLDKYPAQLDYAARRIVAVARAFAAKPRILLLDEPGAGLDSAERQRLGQEIRRMVETAGVGVLIVEHDVDFVFGLCDRVIALEAGRVIAVGSPAEVRYNSQVIASYLGRVGEIEADHKPEGRYRCRPAETKLKTSSLSVGYHKVPVVRELELEVRAGEVVALLGRNGAGKTTILRTVAGFIPELSGELWIDGCGKGDPPHVRSRKGLALVPEERAIIRRLTVQENLRLGRGPAAAAFDIFPELKPLRTRRAGLLSGGEQQMLAIGRSLAAGPVLLLVDEMSFGLAPMVVRRLSSAIRAAADRGIGVLLVEQHPDIALAIADRGYVLGDGRVMVEDTAAELKRRWPEIEASYLASNISRPS